MRRFLAISLMLVTSATMAANFGTLRVNSKLNAPFVAEIPITDIVEGENPRVELALADAYSRHGLTYPAAASGLRITEKSKFPRVYRISGAAPVHEESFRLILLLKNGADATKTMAFPIRLSGEKVRDAKKSTVNSIQVGKNKPQETIATAPKKTTTSAVDQALRTVDQTPVPRRKESAAAPKKSENAKTAQAARKNDSSVLIVQGTTSWRIAQQFSPSLPQARLEQIAVATVRANPKCFANGSIVAPVRGCRVQMPSLKAATAVPPEDAFTYVKLTPKADARKPLTEEQREKVRKRLPKHLKSLVREERPIRKPAVVRSEPVSVEPTQNRPVATPVVAEPHQPKPEGTAPVAQEPIAPPQTPQAQSAQVDDDDSLSWFDLLSGLLLAIGAGAFYFFFYKKGFKRIETVPTDECEIAFRHPEPMTQEQSEGVRDMVNRRLESERATQRMAERASAANETTERQEPTLGNMKVEAPELPADMSQEPVLEQADKVLAVNGTTSADGTVVQEVQATEHKEIVVNKTLDDLKKENPDDDFSLKPLDPKVS